MQKRTVLYIHGMGGGADSRIPSILREHINSMIPEDFGLFIDVIVRTYDFDPDIADGQIRSWIEELQPSLIIGESLGSIHALRIKGLPHLLVSPALNAPVYLSNLAFLTLIPGVSYLLGRIYKPRKGERQVLKFTYGNMVKWRKYRREVIACSPGQGGKDYFHAYFGTRDHYRKSGIVRVGSWKKHYGDDTYSIYDGTHFMEEEYVMSMLAPDAIRILRESL